MSSGVRTNPRFAAAIARASLPAETTSPGRLPSRASSSDLSSAPASDIEDAPGDGSSRYFQKKPSAKVKREISSPAAREPTPSTGDLVAPIKPRRVQKQKVPANTAVAAPEKWQEIYTLVQEMRARNPSAPVDTMGCERLHASDATPQDKRFQTLISLMLSSQTKDTVNAVAMKRLHTELEGGLTLDSILKVDSTKLGKLIDVVGFHRRKTEYIKKTTVILRDQWKGEIPDTADGLMSLPGIGPKMAHLCMSAAWGRTEGIGVDVHVHRITNLWGWNKTTTPEATRAALESWLPRDKWHEINHLLVGFGQTVCLPRGRKCGECLLAETRLCPAAFKGEVSAPRKRKKKVIKTEVKEEEEEGEPLEDNGHVGRRSTRKRIKIEYKEEEDEYDDGKTEMGDIEDSLGM